MKKGIIILTFASALSYVLLSSYSAGPASGFPAVEGTGVTGTSYCGGGCHGTAPSSSVTTTMTLMSGATPVTTYIAGASYTIVVSATYTTSSSLSLPRFGFQVSAVKTSTTTNAGTLSATTGAHTATASGINVVEHNSPLVATTGTGGTGTIYTVNIPWTAPATGTGSVTIHGVINAVNFNGASAGDQWDNATLAVTESTSAVPAITGTATVCKSATTTLANATTGGTWSSSTPSVATVGSSSGIVTGVAAGTATITYTVTAGTSTRVVTVNNCPTGLNITPVQEDGLSVYPNPATSSVTLLFASPLDEDVHVNITNVTGKLVRTLVIKANAANELWLNQPPSIYFITAATAQKTYFAKLSIE